MTRRPKSAAGELCLAATPWLAKSRPLLLRWHSWRAALPRPPPCEGQQGSPAGIARGWPFKMLQQRACLALRSSRKAATKPVTASCTRQQAWHRVRSLLMTSLPERLLAGSPAQRVRRPRTRAGRRPAHEGWRWPQLSSFTAQLCTHGSCTQGHRWPQGRLQGSGRHAWLADGLEAGAKGREKESMPVDRRCRAHLLARPSSWLSAWNGSGWRSCGHVGAGLRYSLLQAVGPAGLVACATHAVLSSRDWGSRACAVRDHKNGDSTTCTS